MMFLKVDRAQMSFYLFFVFAVECPALEDDELASKIELLYADIPVIARYRHKLTALKWAHTGWNGL